MVLRQKNLLKELAQKNFIASCGIFRCCGWCLQKSLLQGLKQWSGGTSHSNLVCELGCFLRKRTRRLRLMVILWRFFICSFEGQDVSGLQFSGPVIRGSGICKLILLQRNRLSLCVNYDVHNISFSTAMMLSTATMILVIWLWLVSIQLAKAWGQRGQERV